MSLKPKNQGSTPVKKKIGLKSKAVPEKKMKVKSKPASSKSVIVNQFGEQFDKAPKLITLPQSAYDDPLAFLTSLNKSSNSSELVEQMKDFSPIVENELNLQNMILEAFEDAHRNMAPKDLRIDDSAFPQAKNFYQWVTDDDFGGTNDRPFLEQLIWAVQLFAEFCPRCSDTDWLIDGHKVDDTYRKFEKKVCMLEYGVCPSCGARKSSLYRRGEINFYQELAVRAGQRAGKSLTVGSTISPYLMHRYLKLQKPPAAFGLSNNTTFIGTFVAINYAQAKEALWDYYYNAVSESRWFKGYHAMLKDYEHRTGEHLMKFNDTFTSYRVRNLLIYPAGPDKRALRGRTRFLSCLTGDSLVSTSRGLIPIRDASIIGTKTHKGNSSRTIVNHMLTGVRDVWKVKLQNGLQLKATDNHPFLCLSADSTTLVWKRQDELVKGDVVAVSLGGEFPKTLPLIFRYTREKTKAQVMFDYMISQSSGFLLSDLADYCDKTYRGVTADISKLNAAFPKALSRSRVGSNSPFLYKVADKKDLLAYMEQKNEGKITENREALVFPTEMTEALAYMIGYLISDGNYIQNGYEISFTSTGRKKINHFYECFEECFGIPPRISSWKTVTGKTAYSVVFGLKPIRDFFEYIGLTPALSSQKIIPWSIMQAPRNCVSACLSAMVSCDGSINGDRLYYSSRSKKLIQHVQLLFMRLGYACRSTYGANSRVVLTSYDRDAFLVNDYTGFKKRSYHKRYEESGCAHSSSHINYVIPGAHSVNNTRTWENCNVYAKTEMNSRCEDTSDYAELIDSGLIFSKVVSMSYVGKKKVYDITVDSDDHTFTANGMSVHNSVDEIGWFDSEKDSKKVKVSGHAIYDALDRSLGTIRQAAYKTLRLGFDNIPNAYAANVSSPSSLSDKICELTRLGHNSRTILAIHRPTWEINPEFPRNCEVIADAYQKDAISAERDWGANPPLISNPFLGNHKYIMNTVGKKKNPFDIIYKVKNGANSMSSYRWAEMASFKESDRPTVVAIDAGHVNNSFASVSAYKDGDYFIIDSIVEVQPLPGFPLNYNRMYEKMLKPQIVFRNGRALLADRWNSIKLLDDAEEELGVMKKQYSLKYKDMWYVKNAIEGGKVILPRASKKGITMEELIGFDGEYPAAFEQTPVEHALFQMATVRDNGSQVLKGDNVTDDIFRAICLAIYGLTCGDYDEVLQKQVEEQRKGFGIAVGRLGSGGSKTHGSGGTGSSIPMGVTKSLGR